MSLLPNSSKTDALDVDQPSYNPKASALNTTPRMSLLHELVMRLNKLDLSEVHPSFSLFPRFITSCMQRTQQLQMHLPALQGSRRRLLCAAALHYAPSWFSQMVSQLAGQMFCTRTLLQRQILIVAGDRSYDLVLRKKKSILRLFHIKGGHELKIGDQCTKDSSWGLDYGLRHRMKRSIHPLNTTHTYPLLIICWNFQHRQ